MGVMWYRFIVHGYLVIVALSLNVIPLRKIFCLLSYVYSIDGNGLSNDIRLPLCLMKIHSLDFSGHFKDLSNRFQE